MHCFSSHPISSSIPACCSFLFSTLGCPPIFHVYIFMSLWLEGCVSFNVCPLIRVTHLNQRISTSSHSGKRRVLFFSKAFSLFSCFPLVLQLCRCVCFHTFHSSLLSFPVCPCPSLLHLCNFPSRKRNEQQQHYTGLFSQMSCTI